MEGHGKPQNLDNFGVVSREFCKLARRIWQNFWRKTVFPNLSHMAGDVALPCSEFPINHVTKVSID